MTQTLSKPASSAAPSDLAQRRPGLRGSPGPVEGRHLEAEPETHRFRPLTGGPRCLPRDVRGRGAHAGRLGQHEVEALVPEPRLLLPKLPGLPREHPLGDTLVALAIARATLGERCRKGHADARHGVLVRERQPLPAPVRIETERVDDGGQPSLRPPLDDLLEQARTRRRSR